MLDNQGSANEPVGQTLKVIELLDCVAGRADNPATGEPIAIVTVGHLNQVEQPLMLRLRDTKALAVKLLAVLANYGDVVAQNIIENQYPEHLPKDIGDARSTPDAPASEPSSDGTVLMGFRDSSVQPIQMSVLGGYRCGQSTMIFLRCANLTSAPVIAVARLVKKNMLRFRGLRKCDTITGIERQDFLRTEGGRTFSVGKKICRKLRKEDLERIVQSGPFICID